MDEKIIEIAKEELGTWIEVGTAQRGWFTCTITGKKMRGEEAQQQIIAQTEKMNEIAQREAEEEDDQAEPAISEVQEELISEIKEEKKRAKRVRKVQSIDMIKKKYPHVKEIIEIAVTDEEIENGDITTIMKDKFPLMTEKLMEQTAYDMSNGKREFVYYEIECVDCDSHRVIKPQDAFQVKRCEICTVENRKARRRKA